MNPFDLRGPEFLAFYLGLTVCVVGAAWLARRWMERGPVPKLTEVDPYSIALLRAGAGEGARVAIVSLLDRGALRHDGEKNIVVGKIGPEHVRRPLEREILAAASQPRPAATLTRDTEVRVAERVLEDDLARLRLLPDIEQKGRRAWLVVAAMAVLGVTAAIKLAMAFERARANVAVLLIGAGMALFLVFAVTLPRRTPAGNRLVADLRTLFARLYDRRGELPAGGATNELALLAGIFGLAALEDTALASALTLFPAPATTSSSCGSSYGSSCGSSCGGGGCGGGCGGCGS